MCIQPEIYFFEMSVKVDETEFHITQNYYQVFITIIFESTLEYKLQHIEGMRQMIQIRTIIVTARDLPDCKEGLRGWHVAKYLIMIKLCH